MKYVDTDDFDKLPGIRLEKNDIFSFHCHPELSCFNQCCRNLNLFLYPYDVIRLRKRLSITSDQFLDRYVNIILRSGNYFPDVLLQMSDNKEMECPFLTGSGCSVYPDRPDACRTFPIEQGLMYDAETKKKTPVSFFRPPDFCMGQYESKEWTTSSWAEDQGAVVYNKMTALWSEVKSMFQSDPWGSEGMDSPRGKMAFMATYNIDQFRNFVFKSTFLKKYRIKPEILRKIKKDDVELMKLGFKWVKFYIWGIKTKYITQR